MINSTYQHPREFIKLEEPYENLDIMDYELPFIKLEYNTIIFNVLVDTGSEVSLVNEEILNRFKSIFQKSIVKGTKISLQTANGKKLADVNKVINLVREFEGEIVSHSFIVMPDMKLDMLVGSDFLNKNNATINLEKRYVLIKGERIEFIEANMNMNNEKLINNLFNVREIKEPYSREEMVNINENEIKKIKERIIACPQKHNQCILDIFIKHKGLFNEESRITKVYEHWLDVKETKPFNVKTYPIPYKHREQVKQEINKMLNDGIIEKSVTNFINPVVIVKKKDDSIRICLDARKINEITNPQYDKPVHIESIIGRLKANYVYSKIDLKNSFWLIPLNKNSRKYTGFSIEGNIYQFKVVPFGLQSSSAALIRALQVILNPYDDFCIHYVDDILIYSENVQEHIRHLKKIFEALDNANLKINIDKCEFFSQEVQYLGYIINKKGITINENRLAEIKNYPKPTNLRTLRGFLGILNYYKRFINNLSEKQVPLVELLRKAVRWKWDERREKAFIELKNNFHDNLMLYSPDYEETFILRTDGSDYAISGELVQYQNGIEVPISFVSRVLKGYETRYSTPEKEMLGLCYSISRLRFFLISNHFIVETDHAALQYLMNNRFTNNRIYRWSLLLQEYNFTVKHIPGKTNITADALSRINEDKSIKPNTFLVALNKFRDLKGLYSEREILNSQQNLTELRNKINGGNYKGYQIKDQFIIKKFQDQELYVTDENLAKTIIKDLHIKFGHIGIRKTWKIFRENYYAKNDVSITKICLNKCELCCLGKYKNHINQNTVNSIVVSHPLEIVSIDYISNLVTSTNKNRHILVIVDLFSKFVKAYPCQKCDTNTTILLINKYYREIGKPRKILTDNATYFNNDRFKSFCHENNINLNFTSIRHPQGNPVERYNQEVIKFLRLYSHKKT